MNRCGNVIALFFLLGAPVATPLSAIAQTNSEAEQIRQELRQLKQDYQQRIDRLEERLRALEAPGAPTVTNVPPKPAAFGQKPATPPAETAQMTNAAAAARQFADEQFRSYSESQEGLRLSEPAVRERLEQVLQDYVEFHGYFRAGYGRDNQGGPQVGFQAPGALSKYRLGNEAENYGEIMFAKNFYVPNMFSLDPNVRPDGTPTGPIARVEIGRAHV